MTEEEFVDWLKRKNVGLLKALKVANKLGEKCVEIVFDFYNIHIDL